MPVKPNLVIFQIGKTLGNTHDIPRLKIGSKIAAIISGPKSNDSTLAKLIRWPIYFLQELPDPLDPKQ
jgi:hypothetical protein